MLRPRSASPWKHRLLLYRGRSLKRLMERSNDIDNVRRATHWCRQFDIGEQFGWYRSRIRLIISPVVLLHIKATLVILPRSVA